MCACKLRHPTRLYFEIQTCDILEPIYWLGHIFLTMMSIKVKPAWPAGTQHKSFVLTVYFSLLTSICANFVRSTQTQYPFPGTLWQVLQRENAPNSNPQKIAWSMIALQQTMIWVHYKIVGNTYCQHNWVGISNFSTNLCCINGTPWPALLRRLWPSNKG